MRPTSEGLAPRDSSDQELTAFLDEARAFLDATCAARSTGPRTWEWGDGDDRDVAIWDEGDREEQARVIAESRAWRRKRFDAGFGWIDGDAASGGAGRPSAFRRGYERLERSYVTPDQSFFKLDRVIAPVLLATDEAFAPMASALYRGDTIICECFTEPDAGSDILSLQTRAERVADGWRLDGQKTWIIDAHFADVGLVLARTNSDGRASEGLTTFLVELDAPGVSVEPLRLMTGGLAFNSVVLDGVVIPDSSRVGDVGAGWPLAREILRREQSVIGGAGFARSGAGIANGVRLSAMLEARGASDDPLLRQQFGEIQMNFWIAKQFTSRSAVRPGQTDERLPSPMLGKLWLSQNLRSVSRFVSDLLGEDLASDNGEWGSFAWSSFVLGEPGIHLFAGTDEIVHNIIGEGVLGLDREPRSS